MTEQDVDGTGLIYVLDSEPGLRRIGAGRGFFYRDVEGHKVTDRPTLARIRALAIPPAWSDVWICPHEDGHLQATGRDARGRKQYRYHSIWEAERGKQKFASLPSFAKRLPQLRGDVQDDMRQRRLTQDRVLATVIWLLDKTLIRVGNDSYAKDNKSFGLTTLQVRHLSLTGSRLRLSFTGKSGRRWMLKVTDRRVARTIRQLQDLPGQRLFRYVDEDGALRDVHSQDVNDYMRRSMGGHFTSKDFRTWSATLRAAVSLARTEVPEAKTKRTAALNMIVASVADELHHTRSVCRQCYIHPQVVSAWEEGRLAAQMDDISKRRRQIREGLEADEDLVLQWLERFGRMMADRT